MLLLRTGTRPTPKAHDGGGNQWRYTFWCRRWVAGRRRGQADGLKEEAPVTRLLIKGSTPPWRRPGRSYRVVAQRRVPVYWMAVLPIPNEAPGPRRTIYPFTLRLPT
jgi:hypothetical protein